LNEAVIEATRQSIEFFTTIKFPKWMIVGLQDLSAVNASAIKPVGLSFIPVFCGLDELAGSNPKIKR
jgi:hypothetical protein